MSNVSTSATEPAGGPILVETVGLSSGYGKARVVRDISLQLRSRQVLGVIGRNGVGKTTLVKTIIGLIPLMAGSVLIRGRDVSGREAHLISRMGIGYVPQGRGIFPGMTVHEHLLLGGYLLEDSAAREQTLERIYGIFPVLKERHGQLAGSLSGGQQEMLAIGRALAGGPSILILDEPSEGIQPNIVDQIGDVILNLNAQTGLSVILIDQNASLIAKCVDTAYAIDKGQVTACLSAEEVSNEARLSEVLSV